MITMEQFNKINDDIEKSEIGLVDNVSKKQQVDQVVKMIELETEYEVANETEEGKKKYTNENARKAETGIRLNKNKKYMNKLVDLDLIVMSVTMQNISVSKLKRTFSAMKAMCYQEGRQS